MALVKETLAAAIKAALESAYTSAQDKEITRDVVITQWSNNIANAFDDYIKTMEFTIPIGQIAVTGSAAAQANTIPLPIVPIIS